jgi:hypothetical protein
VAVLWKQKLMEEGWAAALEGSNLAERLCTSTGGPSATVAEALRGLWAEVVACQASGASVDYDACLAALEE